MKIMMTGCCSGFGVYVRSMLEKQGHTVWGIGLQGPDMKMDFTATNPEYNISTAFDRCGPFDVLICNAGITHLDWLEDHRLEDWDKVLRVNLTIPFLFNREFVRRAAHWTHDPAGGFYRIINTTTMANVMRLRTNPAYNASKAGLESFTIGLAKEFAQRQPFSAVCIAPGGVDDTHMQREAEKGLVRTRGMTPEQASKYNRQSPLGRNATHDEVWKLFDFAVNQAPMYLSGAVLRLNGGMGIN